MSKSIVECIPNFSEGRDRAVIDAIAHAIRSIPEVQLLDIDPGYATNLSLGRPTLYAKRRWPLHEQLEMASICGTIRGLILELARSMFAPLCLLQEFLWKSAPSLRGVLARRSQKS